MSKEDLNIVTLFYLKYVSLVEFRLNGLNVPRSHHKKL